jgi:hypothetical protein
MDLADLPTRCSEGFMRELTKLGFVKSSDIAQLSLVIGGRDVPLPSEYIAFLGYTPPDDVALGFKFVDSETGEEWEGQVSEFMRYSEETVNDAVVSTSSVPGKKLLPIAVDSGGNYLYLDLVQDQMNIIDVSYSSGRVSVIAKNFSDFLNLLYDLS